MSPIKVKFDYGDNEIFDFYILSEKKDVEIDKNSLAYKIDNDSKVSVIQFNGIVFGNFDYLLEKRRKATNEFCGYELALKDEVIPFM